MDINNRVALKVCACQSSHRGHFDSHCVLKGKGGGREEWRVGEGGSEWELAVRTSGYQGQNDGTKTRDSDKQLCQVTSLQWKKLLLAQLTGFSHSLARSTYLLKASHSNKQAVCKQNICWFLCQAVLPKANPHEFGRVAGLDNISPTCFLLPIPKGRIVALKVGSQLNHVSQYSIMEKKNGTVWSAQARLWNGEGEYGDEQSLKQYKSWSFTSQWEGSWVS